MLKIGNMGSKALKGTEDIWEKDHSRRGGQHTLGVCLRCSENRVVASDRGNKSGKREQGSQGDGAVAEILWGCFVTTLAFVLIKGETRADVF